MGNGLNGWTRVKRGVDRALYTARVLLFHGGLDKKPTSAGPKNMVKLPTAVQFRANMFNLRRVRRILERARAISPVGMTFF